MYGNSGNNYRVTMLSKSYLCVIGITIQSLKWIRNYNISKLAKRANRYDGPILIIEKLHFFKSMFHTIIMGKEKE